MVRNSMARVAVHGAIISGVVIALLQIAPRFEQLGCPIPTAQKFEVLVPAGRNPTLLCTQFAKST